LWSGMLGPLLVCSLFAVSSLSRGRWPHLLPFCCDGTWTRETRYSQSGLCRSSSSFQSFCHTFLDSLLWFIRLLSLPLFVKYCFGSSDCIPYEYHRIEEFCTYHNIY
jgi:hypothetical protein